MLTEGRKAQESSKQLTKVLTEGRKAQERSKQLTEEVKCKKRSKRNQTKEVLPKTQEEVQRQEGSRTTILGSLSEQVIRLHKKVEFI